MKFGSIKVNGAVTDRNEIGDGAERVVSLRRGERLHTEVAAVAGKADPESELVGYLDRIHFGASVSVCLCALTIFYFKFSAFGMVTFVAVTVCVF